MMVVEAAVPTELPSRFGRRALKYWITTPKRPVMNNGCGGDDATEGVGVAVAVELGVKL